MLVLASTRELAIQIHESFMNYGAFASVRVATMYGGVGQQPQVRALKAGVDIVVATPGRLLDLMQQGYVNLEGLKVLVLDEADRMLDMGFFPAIRRILQKIPKKRQTLGPRARSPEEEAKARQAGGLNRRGQRLREHIYSGLR